MKKGGKAVDVAVGKESLQERNRHAIFLLIE